MAPSGGSLGSILQANNALQTSNAPAQSLGAALKANAALGGSSGKPAQSLGSILQSNAAPQAKGGGGIMGAIEGAGHWVAQKADIAAHDIKQMGPGAIGLVNTAVVQPWKDVLTTGHVSAAHSAAIDKAQQSVMQNTFAPLAHPLADPFATATLLLPSTHALATPFVRGAEVTKAIQAGEGAAGAAKALIRTPVPAARTLTKGDATTVIGVAARHPVARLGQMGYDALAQRALNNNPQGLMAAHAGRRIGNSLIETTTRQAAIRQAPAAALEPAVKAAAKADNVPRNVAEAAMNLTSINRTAEQAAAAHTGWAAAATGKAAADNLKWANTFKDVARRGIVTTDAAGNAVIDQAKYPNLHAADRLIAGQQDAGKAIIGRYQLMTPAGEQARLDSPGQAVSGGKYVEPTPGALGTPSQGLIRARAYTARLEGLAGRAAERDAANATPYPNVHVTGAARPRTPEEAQALLQTLEARHEALIQKLMPQGKLSPQELKARQQETMTLNRQRTSGGKTGPNWDPTFRNEDAGAGRQLPPREGVAGGIHTPTILEQDRAHAEQQLAQLMQRHAGTPEAQRYMREQALAAQLRESLNPLAGEQSGDLGTVKGAYSERAPGPKTPGVPSDMPAAGTFTPATQRLGTALTIAREHLARMEANAAAKVQPTGMVGGEGAPGRGFTSYKTSVPKGGRNPFSRTPGSVVGGVKNPIGGQAFKAEGMQQGMIPDRTSRGVSNHMATLNKYVNDTTFRDAVVKTGSDLKQTKRDVLVRDPNVTVESLAQKLVETDGISLGAARRQAAQAMKITPGMDEILGRKVSTLDELSPGELKGLEAHLQDMIPGRHNNFATDEAAAIGTPATPGYRWVDKGSLGDLGKPVSSGRNLPARAMDNINSNVTAMTVYYKLGHFGMRLATNAGTNIMQGSASPLNTWRAFQWWKGMSGPDRARVLAAAGQHGYMALPHEGTGLSAQFATAGAHWWASHVDAPFRFNSLVFEARKAGFNTPAKFMQLIKYGEDPSGLAPQAAANVDQIFRTANREQIRYDGLNSFEKNVITRALWFYPWTKGAVGFTLRSAIEHPYKFGGLAQAGVYGRQQQEQQLGPVTDYNQGLWKIGANAAGLPTTMDLSSLSPYSTGADVLHAIARPGEIAGMANPALGALIHLITGTNKYGGKSKSPVMDALLGLGATTPEEQVANAYLGRNASQANRQFPNSGGWGGMRDAVLRALLGADVPRTYNPSAGRSAAARQRAGR
jgi:hypothetical protein